MKTPYNSKPWPVRAYRWLRWRPLYAARFCWWMVRWAAGGAKVPDMIWEQCKLPVFKSRRHCVEHLWTVSVSMAEFKMGNFVLLSDWMAWKRAGSV